jgi:hypothetical protein
MPRRTQFEELIEKREFTAASELLRRELVAGVVLNPRDTAHWYQYADFLARAFREAGGLAAPEPFWREMLQTFVDDIEPAYGRVHKGHIYFRLAWAVCERSPSQFVRFLASAREEDVLSHIERGLTPLEADRAAMEEGAHIALALAERLDTFPLTDHEKGRFLSEIVIPAYTASVGSAATDHGVVMDALRVVIPAQLVDHAQQLYRELIGASSERLMFGIVTSTGALAETVLLGVLRDQHGVTSISRRRGIHEVELGTLFHEAVRLQIFPSPQVQVVFGVVHHFRNRIHPGNETHQRYRLTWQVSDIVRVILEFGLLQWAAALKP